ncbi:Uncharacterised protein [Serratia fonticola]|uniref:Uncharacterized protein n=1 Tax=Serratia fonticola TaxID=47917 RepID=A0A3S4WK06_SERFO|nr:Uncharacterised protein [Serratia fonticola]
MLRHFLIAGWLLFGNGLLHAAPVVTELQDSLEHPGRWPSCRTIAVS